MKKPVKVAVAKALKELDYKTVEIAEILGIPARTTYRYVKEETDEHWEKFGTQLKRLITVTEEQSAAETLAEIRKKTKGAQFRDLVGWYKIIRELRQPKVGIAQQFNVGGEMKLEFVKDES